MSTNARHRDTYRWWERDQRRWADVAEWFTVMIAAPALLLVAVLAMLGVIG